jgi:hypothetical protein
VLEIYTAIRNEIVENHILMHWFSIVVALTLLVGVFVVETRRTTILSVFLPLLSLAWAAAMVRFDFFIHRQAAYLRELESRLPETGVFVPMWESWKTSLQATPSVIPAADAIASAVIVVPTIYLLFGPSLGFFRERGWKGGKAYAYTVSTLMILLLLSLTVIPRIAAWGHEP